MKRQPNLKLSQVCALLALAVFVSTASGQGRNPTVTKAQAISGLKVSTYQDWPETVSETGRFRILFPGRPKLDDNVVSVTGFRWIDGDLGWFAYYTDFAESRLSDDASLRTAYHDSVAAIAEHANARLLSQRDICLNGRLGIEFVIEAKTTVSYMRSFLFGSRMYILSVDRKGTVNGVPAIPADVQQFFESFAYWDQNASQNKELVKP